MNEEQFDRYLEDIAAKLDVQKELSCGWFRGCTFSRVQALSLETVFRSKANTQAKALEQALMVATRPPLDDCGSDRQGRRPGPTYTPTPPMRAYPMGNGWRCATCGNPLNARIGDRTEPLQIQMTFNPDHGAAFVTELPKLYAPELKVQIRFDLV